MNQAVTLAPCAVSHGNLTVTVSNTPQVSQPNPLSGGKTTVTNQADISINTPGSKLISLPNGANLSRVVAALNALGRMPGADFHPAGDEVRRRVESGFANHLTPAWRQDKRRPHGRLFILARILLLTRFQEREMTIQSLSAGAVSANDLLNRQLAVDPNQLNDLRAQAITPERRGPAGGIAIRGLDDEHVVEKHARNQVRPGRRIQ